jgi:hypothetical protein
MKERVVLHSTGTGTWKASGPSTQKLEATTTTIGGVAINVYRLSEPGQWYMDFYRDADYMQGLLLQEVDVYGNKNTYKYLTYEDYDDSELHTPRLAAIYLNGESAADANGEILLDWYLPALETSDPQVPLSTLGKLQSIRAYRFQTGRGPLLLQSAAYRYKEDDDGLSADLGTAGDLIQVINGERVDSSPELPLRFTVTQYRYHTAGRTHSSSNARITVTGGDHQLKHVIRAEQIEYLAQLEHQGDSTLTRDAVLSTAAGILTKNDADTFSTSGVQYIDLPSKIVGYSSGKVSVQYLQTSCGCSGASQGTQESFTYFHSGSDSSTTVTESVWNGSSYVAYRKHYNDMKAYSGVPYLYTYAIEDSTNSANLWVWHYEYGTNQNLAKMMYPSAKATYGPAITAAATYSAQTGVGLVYGWEYNGENRLTQARRRYPASRCFRRPPIPPRPPPTNANGSPPKLSCLPTATEPLLPPTRSKPPPLSTGSTPAQPSLTRLPG